MNKSTISLMLVMALSFALKAIPAYSNPVQPQKPDDYKILLYKDGFFECAVKNPKNDLFNSVNHSSYFEGSNSSSWSLFLYNYTQKLLLKNDASVK